MGVRSRRARTHSRTHIVGFGCAGMLGFLALLVIALGFSLGALVNSWLEDLPDYQSADAYLVAEPTQVLDSDNNVIAEYYLYNRRSVTKDEVSEYVLQGVVDTEDQRFYQHNGVDPQGILRAIVSTIFGGSEGASTITQQLVRNTVLSDEQFEQTLKRKVREAYIAIQMEKIYSKDQILMMYLNTIYFGHSAYGIEAASITYFNKSASELTLAEAALLAGLPQSPSYYDPTENPDAAVARRNTVLDRMYACGDITAEERDAAQAELLELNEGTVMDDAGSYPYFTDYVKQLLLEDFDQDTILQGGLTVYTTLDTELQDATQAMVDEKLAEFGNDEVEVALVAIDQSTGYVLAMIGGRDYNTDQFNLATQATRQPGSSFKAITLTAAVNAGMNPDIYLNCNSPLQVTSTWRVQNYGNSQYGTISLRRATWYSSNTGYAQVAEAIGADKIVEMAGLMGIDEELSAYPSITLGTEGIPVIQMAEAYATLAADGTHRDPVVITRIEDRNGNVVYEHEDSPTQAVDAGVAEAVTDVLTGVVSDSSGTGYTVTQNLTVDQPVAGKTGTSENYRDLWFCGYTPQVTVAIWTGYREEGTVLDAYGSEAHPSSLACPIFASFVNYYCDGLARQEFPSRGTTPTYLSNSSWDFSNTESYVNETDYTDYYSYDYDDSDYSDDSSDDSGYTTEDTSGDYDYQNPGTTSGDGGNDSDYYGYDSGDYSDSYSYDSGGESYGTGGGY